MAGVQTLDSSSFSGTINQWANSAGAFPSLLNPNISQYTYSWTNGQINEIGFAPTILTGEGVTFLSAYSWQNNDPGVLVRWQFFGGNGTPLGTPSDSAGSGVIAAYTPSEVLTQALITAMGGLRLRWTNLGATGNDIGGPFARTIDLTVSITTGPAPSRRRTAMVI